MELRKVRPQWPAPEWVEALCTVRTGGFSRAPYDSFNLGTHVGDRPEHVALNRERLREELGAASGVLYLNQIHGTAVVEARSSMTGLPPVDADAAVTRERDLAVAVMTADCLPVLFFNEREPVVAAAHAGWRGLCSGVLENTVNAMKADPRYTSAYLGPCIGPSAFEIGPEVREAFIERDPDCRCCFAALPSGKYLADLPALARRRLTSSGIPADRIYGGDYCTYTRTDLFYSYRREHVTGRMASVIMIRS